MAHVATASWPSMLSMQLYSIQVIHHSVKIAINNSLCSAVLHDGTEMRHPDSLVVQGFRQNLHQTMFGESTRVHRASGLSACPRPTPSLTPTACGMTWEAA